MQWYDILKREKGLDIICLCPRKQQKKFFKNHKYAKLKPMENAFIRLTEFFIFGSVSYFFFLLFSWEGIFTGSGRSNTCLGVVNKVIWV